jgi:hypothetical protein
VLPARDQNQTEVLSLSPSLSWLRGLAGQRLVWAGQALKRHLMCARALSLPWKKNQVRRWLHTLVACSLRLLACLSSP